MIKLKKINRETVKPIIANILEKDQVRGYDLFPEIYANIFLCAKKKSGKTSVINKIIRSCTDKNTNVIVFCSTANKDPNYIEIKKWLKEKEMKNSFFTSLVENNTHVLEVLLNELKKKDDLPEEEDQIEQEPKLLKFDADDSFMKVTIRKKKPKKKAPELLIIFDDLSTELKDKNVAGLLKTNRHYKSKVIISSQYPYDLKPDSRKQFDYWLLFKGQPIDKLEKIYENCDLDIPFEEFVDVYKNATEGNYNFLYVDTNKDKFRKNFNQEYNI